MALIGNRSVLHKSPGRFLSGTIASHERSGYCKAGMLAGRFEALDKLSGGIPGGHLAPSSWALPRTAGGMSSHNAAVVAIAAAGSGALGRGIAGASTITFTAQAVGQLVAGAVGSASFSINATADIAATLGAVGAATFSISATGTPGALGWLAGDATMTLGGSLVAYAVGHMTGSTADQSALTPAGIANAVWANSVRSLTLIVDADIKRINGVEITGAGVPGDSMRPA